MKAYQVYLIRKISDYLCSLVPFRIFKKSNTLKNKLIMKKITLLIFSFLAVSTVMVLAPSCEKVKDIAKFDVRMDLPAQNFDINKPAAKSLHGPVDQYYDFDVTVNLDSIQQKHNLSSFGIENGKITKVLVSITAPEEADFSFLISARLVLFEPNAQEIQVAHTGNINPQAKQIELILDNADITALIKMKNFVGRLYYTIDPELMAWQNVSLQLIETVQFTVAPL